MMAALLGTGLYSSIRLGFFQLRHPGLWLRRTIGSGSARAGGPGTISQFQSMTTALAATVGTGNIAGVATAIALGGPGAEFWMWIAALLGMMTGFAENVLGICYRVREPDGTCHGGPMYYMERGLGLKWLGLLFAFFCMLAAFGIGGMIQSLVTLTSSNLLAPGVGLYLTAILLVVADMLPEGEKTQKNLKPKDALIAGFFQGFSTIPGLSRLGSTISACVIGGMTRSYAVKYSLIVSVPAIIGATIVEIATMGKNKIVFHPVYLVGVFMAALAGYFTIRILMRVVKKRKLKYFALYCLLVGTFSIAGYFLL